METIYYPENCLAKRGSKIRRNVRFSLPNISSVELHVWFERDRAMVELRHKVTGKSLIEFWDEDVSNLIEDGFLNPSDFKGSLYEMLKGE